MYKLVYLKLDLDLVFNKYRRTNIYDNHTINFILMYKNKDNYWIAKNNNKIKYLLSLIVNYENIEKLF